MDTNTENQKVLEVVEEAPDGSAVIDLPEGEEPVEQESSSAEDAANEDHPDDDEEVRAAKRARRRAKKDYAKERIKAERAELDYLKKVNHELMERVSAMERKSFNTDLARLDNLIQEESSRLQYAQALMREATENSDGNAMIKAQEAYIVARDRLREMQEYRKSAQMPEPQPTVDPRMVNMAKDWMNRNSWYDPSGKDEDSQIAKLIDERMVGEGWDPTSEEYWEEFDNRLQRRLPHRYTESQNERPRRPKSFVTGSVRESSSSRDSGGSYVLSPERVRAIKEAGMWDDPQKRQRMIRQFIQYDKTNRS